MAQGLPIAGKAAFATSTTESANQVQSTYDYIGPGKLRLYAKGSAGTVLTNLFLNGQQICRNLPIMFSGTAGTIDTSANLVTEIGTMLGGRVELTFTATTGTPTVDFLLTHEGVPIITPLLNRLRGR